MLNFIGGVKQRVMVLNIPMLCEQAKMDEYGVLGEYLLKLISSPLIGTIVDCYPPAKQHCPIIFFKAEPTLF